LIEASGSETEGVLVAELKGFPRLRGGILHKRRVSWSRKGVEVSDRLEGCGRHRVESALPLAPSVLAEQGSPIHANGVTIESRGPLSCALETHSVSERLYERLESTAVVMSGDVELPVSFGWKISDNVDINRAVKLLDDLGLCSPCKA
jgi:hypothetical protein